MKTVFLLLIVLLTALQAGAARGEPAGPVDPLGAKVQAQQAQLRKLEEAKADERKLREEQRKQALAAAAAQKAQLIAAQAGQFEAQLRPMLNRELDFVRQICDPAPELRPAIRAAGEEGLQHAAALMGRMNGNGGLGIGVNNNVGGKKQSQPQRAIVDRLSESLKTLLTPEQFARYQEEAEKRRENRQRAALLEVVSRLDQQLFLSTQQRAAILADLNANWQENWEVWRMYGNLGNQYYPNVPEKHLFPHLTKAQLDFWKGLRKIELGFWQVQVFNQQPAAPMDDYWGKEDAKARVRGVAVPLGIALPAGE